MPNPIGRSSASPADVAAPSLAARSDARATAALRASEWLRHPLLETLAAAIYTCDCEGRIVWFNDSAAELWGRRPDLDTEKWSGAYRTFSAEGQLLSLEALPIARAVREGQSRRGQELVIERPDGTRRNVITNPQLLRDDNGEVIGAVNLLLDVTDARRAEFAANHLAAIVESSEDAIVSKDLAGTITSWNAGAERLFGYSAAEVVGQAITLLIPPDRHEEEARILERVRRGEKVAPLETRRRCKDGRVIDVSVSVSPIRDSAGRIVGAAKIARDITAQKAAVRAVAESEERLRLATRTGKVGLWEWDIVSNRVTWTDSLFEIHGVARENFDSSAASFFSLVHPDDRAPIERAVQSALKHDTPYELEFRAVRPGGGVVWLFTNAIVVRRDGQPVRMLGATFDVTARKLAELALRESEKRFRTLASHAPVGIFLTDAHGQTIFVNESWCAMTGLSSAEGRGAGWMRAIHPADRERVTAEWQSSFHDGSGSQVEYRFLRDDGTVTWVQGNAIPLRDEAGKLAGYIGTVGDVTQRKLAEERLREQEAQLRVVSDNAPVSLAHLDREGRFLFVNRANAERLRLEPAEIVGRTMEEVVGPAAVRAIQPYVERVLTGQSFSFETEVPYRTIGTRFVRASYAPDLAEDGTVRGWLSAVTDITDRRRTELALQKQNQRLRLISEALAALLDAGDAEAVVRELLPRVAEHLGTDAFFNYMVGDESGVLTLRSYGGVSPELARGVQRLEFGAALCGRVALTAEPLHVTSVQRSQDPAAELVRSFGIDAYACHPLLVESRLLGTLSFASRTRSEFQADEIEFMASIARYVALALDRGRAQAQLQAHASELEHRVRERTASLRDAIVQMEEFSYSVSHDLRAPLRAMRAYAQALAEDYADRLDDTARAYLQRIERSSMRMEKLTHDVLSYSRLARAEMELVPVNVESLVRDVVMQYGELQPPAAHVEIVSPLAPVRAHEAMLGQCFANLLTNAAKFVAPGVTPRIRVWSEVSAGHARVWIEDNGIGIEPRHQQRLFRVFERIPTSRSYEGTGIGLAIVRKAAEKMGGRCGVESDGRQGSRFWVELPTT